MSFISNLFRKLPENYHADYNEVKRKYTWYYLGRHEGKKDYSSNLYFTEYDDAVDSAVKHHKQSKKQLV